MNLRLFPYIHASALEMCLDNADPKNCATLELGVPQDIFQCSFSLPVEIKKSGAGTLQIPVHNSPRMYVTPGRRKGKAVSPGKARTPFRWCQTVGVSALDNWATTA